MGLVCSGSVHSGTNSGAHGNSLAFTDPNAVSDAFSHPNLHS